MYYTTDFLKNRKKKTQTNKNTGTDMTRVEAEEEKEVGGWGLGPTKVQGVDSGRGFGEKVRKE